MSRPTGIDEAWELLFRRHCILERIAAAGSFSISSAEINQVKEARLMAKFDRSAQLPRIFRAHRLSILPVSRGGYLIAPFRTHQAVEYGAVRPRVLPDPGLETLDGTNLYSEAASLLYCYNGGVFHDLLNTSALAFTVNGRMASGVFDFRIEHSTESERSYQVSVRNAQVEIDAGYESPDAFLLCECKNMASEELLIRQLYYPYRLWRSRLRKPVLPLFLACSNDVFHAFLYRFEDDTCYNSLTLVSHTAYTFAARGITLADAAQLWRNTVPGPEPEHPFPQANSFARVVDLLGILFRGDMTRDEVTLNYEFDPRQTDYYITACEYLGLAERFRDGEGEPGCRLTEEARRILALPYREKYLGLMGAILRQPVFHRAFELVLRRGEIPNANQVVRLMLEAGLPLAQNTLERRSSTVRGWLGWILAQCGEGEQLVLP